MKSTVFLNAWELVRTLGITLGNALSIAWAEAKLKSLENDWQIASGKAFNYSEEKAIEQKMAVLIRKVNSIKPCYVNFKGLCNSGASFDYGCGKFNGD